MKNYLTIGELAKIRNLNVQSLRYYEKLGILVPAYINPKSGYRYYTPDQIMILDTVLLCIDLGIPLKELKSYMVESGQLKLEQLLEDGLMIARDRSEKINAGIRTIGRTLKHIHAQKPFLKRDGYYVRHIFERQILSLPCDPRMDAGTYEKYLSRLFQLAKENGLQVSFPHGILSTYENGDCISSCVFLEISDEGPVSETSGIKKIPEGDYLCLREPREKHSPPSAVFPAEIFAGQVTDVIVSSMMPDTCSYDTVDMELQVQMLQ